LSVTNKKIGRSWIAIPVMIAGLSVFALLYFWANQSVLSRIFPTAGYSRSESMKLVDVSLTEKYGDRSISFRIPAAYLTDTENRRGGEQDSLWIEMYLPDLLPYSAFQQEQEMTISEFSGNNVPKRVDRKISLHFTKEKSGDLLNYIQCSDDNPNYKLTISNFSGLNGCIKNHKYESSNINHNYPLNVAEFWSAKDDNGNYFLRIRCDQCISASVDTRYKGWLIGYTLPLLYFKEWYLIDEKVKKKLEEFESEFFRG